MATIFITEKPSVAQEYRRVLKVKSSDKHDGYIEGQSPVLNTDVIITWAVGHLICICPPEQQNEDWKAWKKENLPMIPSRFKYAPLKNTYSQYKIVKSLYTRKDIDCIYYAGDSGREGIYIQALIRNQIFKKAPDFEEKVVWIDSFSDEEILKGIRTAKPYSDYLPMIESGYSRAKDDWLIGMNLTQAFTLTSGGYGLTIPVGRVMTPTLAMVVNRQREIDNFVKTDYYGIKADDFAAWKAVEGTKYFDSPELYNESGFLEKENAEVLRDDLSRDMTLAVSSVKVQNKTEYAPYLFNLADLQAFCSRRFKISPADTLKIAQSLYEKKFTTYPRTDCRFLSTAVQSELKKKGYDIPKRYVDDSKITDHYALIPTLNGDAGKLSGLEAKVYEAIVKRFEDTMKPPFKYNAVSVEYFHSTGEKFFESFRIVTQQGFKEKEDDEEFEERPIPKKNDKVSVKEFRITESETKPPAAYTTGSLILAMEKAGRLVEDEELREQIKTCGIGTSATRSNIIEKLEKNGFITIDKKQKTAPTEKGTQVVDIVAKYDETLVSPVKTAEMEQQLQSIAESKLSAEEHSESIDKYLKDTVSNIFANNTDHIKGNAPVSFPPCPHCKGEIVKGRYGLYCKNSCGFVPSKVYNIALTDAQVLKLLNGKSVTVTHECRKIEIRPQLTKSEWQGKTYFRWSAPRDYAQEPEINGKKLACPHCGAEVKAGNYGFYCTAKCGMNLSAVYGHQLTDAQVLGLLNGEGCSFVTKKKNVKRKTTVLPEVVKNEWHGKTYYNWKTE